MTTLQDLLFDVEKVDFENHFGVATNSDYSHAIIANIGSGNEKVLNVCSDRYELVPNKDIFVPIRQMLGDNNINFSERYTMTEDKARFYASYTLEDNGIKIGDSDDYIKPEMRITHSYNGLEKYSISFGYFRLICSNGMVIPVKGKEQFNFNAVGKHTANIKHNISKLTEKIEYFVNNSELASKGFNELYDNWVADPRDRVKEVLSVIGLADFEKDTTRAKNLAAERLDSVMNIITAESKDERLGETYVNENGELENLNDWMIYNGINNFVHNVDENKKTPTQKFEYDTKMMEFMLT